MKKNKKKKYRINNMFLDAYKETGRKSLVVFLILRALVIICMCFQLLKGDIFNALLCLLSLVLLVLPSFLQRKLDISLPGTLETIIYLFIFSSTILGEINNFYGIIPFWDTILHTLNGFLCAAIGFSLVELLNKSNINFNLSPIYLCLVAFCFSMTIGVCWEFYEYTADKFLNFDMQKDTVVKKISSVSLNEENKNEVVTVSNIDHTIIYDKSNKKLATINNGYLDIGINDTMKDLFVNFIGALVFCLFGYFYLKETNKKENSFINQFVPKKGKREIPLSVQQKLNEQINNKKQKTRNN